MARGYPRQNVPRIKKRGTQKKNREELINEAVVAMLEAIHHEVEFGDVPAPPPIWDELSDADREEVVRKVGVIIKHRYRGDPTPRCNPRR